MSTIGSPTASSVRSDAIPIPAPILNMPTAKLQSALAKSIMQLKSRDQIISTLKTQLKATQNQQGGSQEGSNAELPTSTPPASMKLNAEAIEAQNAIEAANVRAGEAEARAADLQSQMQQLVEASKQGGEAHAAQLQDLQKELSEAKKVASECKDAKEMQDQMSRSLKAAVAEAMAEKEATFERLGGAREHAAELQDALRSANAQIRMLRAEVAALHEEIDCCGASAPPTPPSVPPSAGGFQGGDAAETKDDSGDVRTEGEADAASAQQDVKELEGLLRATREEVDSVKAALAANNNSTPRAASTHAAHAQDTATSPIAPCEADTTEAAEASKKLLEEAAEREASMEQRIQELEGQIRAMEAERLQVAQSGDKGDKVVADVSTGVPVDESGEKGTEQGNNKATESGDKDEASTQAAKGVSEEEVTKLQGEIERLQAAEIQASQELAWRVQELAAERQRAADAERALLDTQEAGKAEAEHLAAQLAEVREQLVVGASDEALSAHLSEFVSARTALFDVVDAQEAELESLRGQLESAMESQQAASAFAHIQGTFSAMRSALGRASAPQSSSALPSADGHRTSTTTAVVPVTTDTGEAVEQEAMDGDWGGGDWGDWDAPADADATLPAPVETDEAATTVASPPLAADAADVAAADAAAAVAVADTAQLQQALEEATAKAQAAEQAAEAAHEATRAAEAARDAALEKAQAAEAAQQDRSAAIFNSEETAVKQEELTDLRTQIEELQKHLEASSAERDTAQSALAVAEALSQKHEALACELHKDLEAAKASAESSTQAHASEIEDSERKYEELMKLLETAEQERDSARADLEAAQERVSQQGHMMEDLKKDLEASGAKQEAALEDSESEVRKRAAAALKKTKALHEAQMAELRGEVEAALQARHEDTLAAEQRVESERERATQAEQIAAARLQAVTEAEDRAQRQCAAADEQVAEAQTQRSAAEKAREDSEAACAKAVEEKQAAEQAVAEAEASKESAIKEASAREARLKKALAELRNKVDAANSEQSRAEASVAEARTRIEAVQADRATADARAQMMEREVERLQKEASDYRGRAQALLAQKDKEIESARNAAGDSVEKGVGVAEAISMLGEMRAEAAKKEADFAAALAEAQDEKRAADARAEAAVEEVVELRTSLDAALARAAHADALRQRATDAEAQLASRDAAAKAAAAAAAPCATAAAGAKAQHAPPCASGAGAPAGSLQQQLEAARAEAASAHAAHTAFKDMAARMADAREEALNDALQQVAELKAELEDLKAAGAIPTPSTPALPEQPHTNNASNSPTRPGVFDPAHSSAIRRGLGRSDSFELGEVLSHNSIPGGDSAMHGSPSNWIASTQSGDFGAIFGGGGEQKSKEVQQMRARITELEQENEELLGDAAKHEAQLAVLKEELRAVDRAEKRMATSGNAQVMEFLKANIISLYATGEAERLLEPFAQMLALSDTEKKTCKDGLAKWKGLEQDGGGYLGALFGVR